MDEADFDSLARAVEPRLRRALVAWYGPGTGRDAAQVALEWAWTHRDRLADIDNVAGYLFRVGESYAKRERQRGPVPTPERPHEAVVDDPRFEPELASGLEALSDQQRAAVLLVHGHGYSLREAADVLEVSLATLRTHVDRAMQRLRTHLEVGDESRSG